MPRRRNNRRPATRPEQSESESTRTPSPPEQQTETRPAAASNTAPVSPQTNMTNEDREWVRNEIRPWSAALITDIENSVGIIVRIDRLAMVTDQRINELQDLIGRVSNILDIHVRGPRAHRRHDELDMVAPLDGPPPYTPPDRTQGLQPPATDSVHLDEPAPPLNENVGQPAAPPDNRTTTVTSNDATRTQNPRDLITGPLRQWTLNRWLNGLMPGLRPRDGAVEADGESGGGERGKNDEDELS